MKIKSIKVGETKIVRIDDFSKRLSKINLAKNINIQKKFSPTDMDEMEIQVTNIVVKCDSLHLHMTPEGLLETYYKKGNDPLAYRLYAEKTLPELKEKFFDNMKRTKDWILGMLKRWKKDKIKLEDVRPFQLEFYELFLTAYRDSYYSGRETDFIIKSGYKDLLCDNDREIMDDVEERMTIIEGLYLKYAKKKLKK